MAPQNPLARLFYAWVLLLNRRSRQATALMEACPPEIRDTPAAEVMRLLAAAAAGKLGGSQTRLSPQLQAVAAAGDMFPRFLAQGFALAGRRGAALRWLKAAIERGFINYPFLARHDPFFKPLRADARFRRLLELARERWESFEE